MTLIRVNFLFNSIVLLYIYFGYHNTLANVLNLKHETKINLEMVYNKSCLSYNDCDDHMECISNICKHKTTTSTTIPTTISTTAISGESDMETEEMPDPPFEVEGPDFGSVPTIVWISFAVPFVSIMLFIMVCGYRFRRVETRINASNMRQNQQTVPPDCYQPAIVSNTFEEMRSHRPRIQRYHCPPPAYDKIVFDLPPSYDSIQK